MEVYKFQGTGLATKEKHVAEKIFEDYKSQYNLETLGELRLLEELVFRETLNARFKSKIEKLSKNKAIGEEAVIPKHIIEAYDVNQEYVLKMRERLGLDKAKLDSDPLQYFRTLEKKFSIWEEEHKLERQVVCPCCGETFYLHIKTENYQAAKTPMFKDKVLANPHLWKLYKEGKITREDAGLILGTSPDYIDFLDKKVFNAPKDQ